MKSTIKKSFTLFITVILFAFALCVSASAADKIATPKKLRATPTTSSITLKWSEVKKADYYRIYYKTSKDAKWKTALKKTDKTKHTFEKLPSGKKYYFAVRSFDKTKSGTVYSDMKEVKMATMPKKTAKITATPKMKQVKLSWKKVDGATHYRVYQQTNGKWMSIAFTEKTAFTVKELKPATKYSFSVRAYVKSKSYTVAGAKRSISVTTNSKEYDNYVAITKGGLKLYPITSNEAEKIFEKWGLKIFTYYEAKNSEGKTLIYTENGGDWTGLDSSGACYDSNGKIRVCTHCGTILGRADNHCNGGCHLQFS